MILSQILDHDLHRANKGINANPLMVETPAKQGFVPAVVSSCRKGKFIISRSLTKESRIRSGIFEHDPDRVDELLLPLLNSAYELSVSDEFPNIFTSASKAFNYIKNSAGTNAHPHVVLIPNTFSDIDIKKFLGKTTESKSGFLVYNDFCRVLQANIKHPVFFSRPDYVGMYTQFLGGNASIFLHNVKEGMAFVVPKII